MSESNLTLREEQLADSSPETPSEVEAAMGYIRHIENPSVRLERAIQLRDEADREIDRILSTTVID